MIYLLIILGTGQLLLFAFCYKMLRSIKRRYKILDARVANLGLWVVSSTEALSNRLENMHGLLHEQDLKLDNMSNQQLNKTQQPAETVLRPVVNSNVG